MNGPENCGGFRSGQESRGQAFKTDKVLKIGNKHTVMRQAVEVQVVDRQERQLDGKCAYTLYAIHIQNNGLTDW